MRILSLLIGVLVQVAAAAEDDSNSGWENYCSTLHPGCSSAPENGVPGFLIQFAEQTAGFFIRLIGGAAVCAIIYAGFKLATSAGDDAGKEDAKKIIQFAMLGVVLAILGEATLRFVESFVGTL